MERFYLINLAYELLPKGCDIFNSNGKQTNNLAEIIALWAGLKKFKQSYDYHPINIFHDSQIVVYSVSGVYSCKAPHLIPWVEAVRKLWWPKINYQWVPRKQIVEVLGH
jgi:ribonuclease HI